MSDFLKAAASYFGVPAEIISKSEFFAADGQSTFVVEIPVSTEDMMGIADRMKTMGADAEVMDPVTAGHQASQAQMRAEYNGMDPATRGRFGSFGAYITWRTTEGVDVAKAEPALPAYVLLDRSETTDLQRASSGMDPKTGKYMVQVEDLTEDQRARCVQQVVREAEDLGGLPG